ncbi:hypothetical protein EW026_g4654 [Hermanssonia centrifuga]|uniref:Uncharacterized protein n=1 Tax=Hermanssonia centrifuga TaxID=98765 RepID=A0A4S4KGG7_9APHY|nr:hypothetical protein EW026_g4654 [Hermanssonia centrifuga]
MKHTALCRELADHFEGATNKTVQDFELLRLTIDKTLRALKAARLEDGATLTMFDLEAFDTSEISRAFVSARIEIKRCFDKFGMGITWNTRSRSLKESIERDKNRMKQINDLLARAVEVAPPVSVEVKIYKFI